VLQPGGESGEHRSGTGRRGGEREPRHSPASPRPPLLLM
jgi:hypothetical protein